MPAIYSIWSLDAHCTLRILGYVADSVRCQWVEGQAERLIGARYFRDGTAQLVWDGAATVA